MRSPGRHRAWMIAPYTHSRKYRAALPMVLAFVGALVFAVPAAAFSSNWTSPKRILAHDGQPLHASVVDGSGHVHVASEKGSKGIHYMTNKSGSWKTCQLTFKNDRYPSITVAGDVVYFVFARQTAGEKGLYTAASDQPVQAAAGCGFATTKRYTGGAGSSAVGVSGSQMHIAFRTSTKKLKYHRGNPASADWTVRENIDGKCCTSAPAMYFTTSGSVRVAYGDGTKKAEGLKFALRSSGKWKKSKAAGGRVKYVDLVLDHSPGVFTPPNNHPRIAYVVKRKGVSVANKAAPNAKGSWSRFFIGRHFGPTGLVYWSNQQKVLISGKGKMAMTTSGGPIYYTQAISNNGKDSKGVFMGDRLTFSRKGKGVFYTRLK